MKRILLTSWGKGTGGADSVVRTNAAELRRRGIPTDILDRHYNPPFILESHEGGQREFEGAKDLTDEVRWEDYAIVHNGVSTFDKAEFDAIGTRNPRLPWIYTAHSAFVHEFFNDQKNEKLKRQFEFADKVERERMVNEMSQKQPFASQVLTVSRSDRLHHMTRNGAVTFDAYYPGSLDNSVVLPHGTDYQKYNTRETSKRALEERKKLGGGKIIMYAGRILKSKGVFDLVDAFGSIHNVHPDAKLVILGDRNGNGTTEIRKIVRPDHRQSIFVLPWTNSDEDKAAFYKAADIVVIPTYHETFCMTALEAMSLGTPVAISNVDGPREIWVSSMLAYGVSPGDPESIAQRVNYVLSHPEIARENSERVMRTVNDTYDIENVMDAYIALYDLQAQLKGNDSIIEGDDTREQMYDRLHQLSGKRFKPIHSSKPRRMSSFDRREDRVARKVFPEAIRENVRSNGTSRAVHFYSTSGFKYRGVVVEKVTPNELEVLQTVPDKMNGMYRIPKVLLIDGDMVVQQRLYGPSMLDMEITNPATIDRAMSDAAIWLRHFNNPNPRLQSYEIGSTNAYQNFMTELVADTERFGSNEDFVKIGRLLEGKWKHKTPMSKIGLVHGDMSPIHLFYETDGNGNEIVYGIDFNASHVGPVNEDPGKFLGNLAYHMACNGLNRYVEGSAEKFLGEYGTPIETGFYVAGSFYSKARREGHPEKLIRAARTLLEKPFDVNMLNV